MPNATHDIIPVIESEVQESSPLLIGEEDEFSNVYEAHELSNTLFFSESLNLII